MLVGEKRAALTSAVWPVSCIMGAERGAPGVCGLLAFRIVEEAEGSVGWVEETYTVDECIAARAIDASERAAIEVGI